MNILGIWDGPDAGAALPGIGPFLVQGSDERR